MFFDHSGPYCLIVAIETITSHCGTVGRDADLGTPSTTSEDRCCKWKFQKTDLTKFDRLFDHSSGVLEATASICYLFISVVGVKG